MSSEYGEEMKGTQVMPGQRIPGAVPPNGNHVVNFRAEPEFKNTNGPTNVDRSPTHANRTENGPQDRGRGTNDTFA